MRNNKWMMGAEAKNSEAEAKSRCRKKVGGDEITRHPPGTR
jgi:hypothetical protein